MWQYRPRSREHTHQFVTAPTWLFPLDLDFSGIGICDLRLDSTSCRPRLLVLSTQSSSYPVELVVSWLIFFVLFSHLQNRDDVIISTISDC